MDMERGGRRSEVHEWQAPRREQDSLRGIVPERSHREKVDSEVAAAMKKFQYSEVQTKRGLDRRMDEITGELIRATDDQERHRLAVERVALIKYRQELLRQPASTPVSGDVRNAPDLVDVPHDQSVLDTTETFVGEAPEVKSMEAVDAPDVPERFLKQQKKNVQLAEVIKMKSLTEELQEKARRNGAHRSSEKIAEGGTAPGVDLRKRAAPKVPEFAEPSETYIEEAA